MRGVSLAAVPSLALGISTTPAIFTVVYHALPALQMPLMSKERLALHEEQGKRRKPNIRQAVVHIRAAPGIWKSSAGRP